MRVARRHRPSILRAVSDQVDLSSAGSDEEQVIFDGYRTLSEWRYQIRKFLAFSERAARAAGLPPQHHQVLLAIKGLPEGKSPTIRVLAERMLLKANSMVELVDRLAAKGLVKRARAGRDVIVVLTAKSERLLEQLSRAHWRQLQTVGPTLISALSAITAAARDAADRSSVE
jgi:DNA-binding MarR family transcriptional regulator